MYEDIGGFDEAITAGEDYDFQNRLNIAGYKTGFVTPEAVHLGEPVSIWKHMKKYYFYGSDFVAYAERNPNSSKQLQFVRAVYLRNWRKFLRHPTRGFTFIAYSACKFAFGSAGFLARKFKTRAFSQR